MNSAAIWRSPESGLVHTLINGLIFNISCFAIVSTHSSALAPLIASVHLVLHFTFLGRGWPEAVFVAGVTLFGIFLDQALFYFGVFTISAQPALAPVWITCLWPLVATTCMHAFSGLNNRLWLAVLFGGVGGAGSYLAGTSLSDVQFGSPTWGPLIMAVLWMGLFPALLSVAKRCDIGLEEEHVKT